MTNGTSAEVPFVAIVEDMDQNELRCLEELCIQECAPPCAAACPIHVDVRGVALELSRGNIDAALRLLRRTLPFPGIIGRICERPCEAVCKRAEAGEAVAIAALEQACADFGQLKPDKQRPARRNRHVAIVGGGLCGATAAYDLVRKGYGVSLFDALDPLGGRLWDYPEEVLPHALITAELGQLEALGVVLHLNTRVGSSPSLEALRDEHEAILLACGAEARESFGLACDAAGRPAVDPTTYATSQPGIFAAGGMVRGAHSAIGSVMDGRRAAISIDRYLQSVSLTASRAGEGPQTSCLYTNTEGIAPLPRVAPANPARGYTAEEAAAEARRCLQCECLECVKVCEYLAAYGRYPRKYVREVYNNLSIVKGTRYANQFINSCSLCGLCAAVCPTGLDMGAVNLAARGEMVATGRMPPSAHDFALRELAYSQSEHFSLARNAPGTLASDYAFFPGCQLSGSAPEHVIQAYDYLNQVLPAGTRVGLWLGCCGAPAEWAARRDVFEQALAHMRAQHAALGRPRLILACASCERVLASHLPEIETVSLWALMAERGLPDGAADGAGQTVSIHDPCAARHATAVQDSVRRLVERLGYRIAELPRSRTRTTCCSHGGAMWLANRQVARTVVQRRIEEGPDDYVTYCATCRDFLAGHGKRTLHLLDLVFDDPAQRAARPDPGWSQRRANRAGLKRRLLSERWGEPMSEPEPAAGPRLMVSDAVAAMLEERLILLDDVRFVIDQAERSGRKLLRPATGHLIASARRGAVTFWVEYAPEGEAFVVYGAYSHRMEVMDATLPTDAPGSESTP